MYRLLHISSVKSFREDQNHLLRHITYHTKGQMKHLLEASIHILDSNRY